MDAFARMMKAAATSGTAEAGKSQAKKKQASQPSACAGQMNLFQAFKMQAPEPRSCVPSAPAPAEEEAPERTVTKKRPARKRRKDASSSSSSDGSSASDAEEEVSAGAARAKRASKGEPAKQPRRPRRVAPPSSDSIQEVEAGGSGAQESKKGAAGEEPAAGDAPQAPRRLRVSLRKPPAAKPAPAAPEEKTERAPRTVRKAREPRAAADRGGEEARAESPERRLARRAGLWSSLQRRELNSGARASVGDRLVARVGALALGVVLGQGQGDGGQAAVQPYTIHVDDECELLAAGGARGLVSLHRLPAPCRFPAPDAYGALRPAPEDADAEEAREAAAREAPVEAVAVEEAHERWVSEVQLVRPAGGAPLLLTASDDATVALWDLRRALEVPGAALRAVQRLPELHTAGIYSLQAHGAGARVATSSKDGTVAVSRLTAAGLVLERALGEVHAGVCKRVRWRPGPGPDHTLASCGNDKAVQVLDVRAPEPVVLRVPDAHSLAVNTVAWSPARDHLLLSSSFDNNIHLYDVRMSGARSRLSGGAFPLCAARGGRAQSILHPTFFLGGGAVLAPVDRAHHLQLFSAADGAPLQPLPLGYTPSALYAHPSSLLAACKGTRLEIMYPVLQP
eukprot:tig00021582_g22614.t1